MIRRQVEKEKETEDIAIEIESAHGKFVVRIRCAKEQHKKIKKFMVDTMKTGSTLSCEWPRIHSALVNIFDNTSISDIAAKEITGTIILHLFSEDIKPHIYEIITD